MFSFLNIEGQFYKTLSKISNYIILGAAWLMACFPIITIGASCTAMYSAHHKVIKNGNGYLWKTFWQQFRANFKQATLLWLIMILIAIILFADFYFLYFLQVAGNASFVLTTFLILAGLCVLWMQYWFPYISHIDDPIGRVLKNTLIICFAHFPRSLLIGLVFGVCIFINLGLPLMPYFILLGPLTPIFYSLCTYGSFASVFSNYWDMTDGNAEFEEKQLEEK